MANPGEPSYIINLDEGLLGIVIDLVVSATGALLVRAGRGPVSGPLTAEHWGWWRALRNDGIEASEAAESKNGEQYGEYSQTRHFLQSAGVFLLVWEGGFVGVQIDQLVFANNRLSNCRTPIIANCKTPLVRGLPSKCCNSVSCETGG